MDNKYLTKVCALLKPLPGQKKKENVKSTFGTKPTKKVKANKYAAKINKIKQRKKTYHSGATLRQHKVK